MAILLVLLFLFLFSILLSLYPPMEYKYNLFFYYLIAIFLIFTSVVFCSDSPDYEGYLFNYAEIVKNNESFSEISFIGISKITYWMFNDICFLFFIYAIIGVTLKFIAIRQLTNFWFLSIVVYLSCFFMLHEMIQIRAGVATGLLLLCIKPLYERKWKLFILLGICACCFHYSALVIFPLWFLKGNRINKIVWCFPLLFAYSFYLMHLTPMFFLNSLSAITMNNERLDGYIFDLQNADNASVSVFNNAQLIRCGVYLFLLFKSDLIARFNPYIYLLLKIYVIGLSTLVFFASVPVIAFRMSEFFQTVEIILYPLICYAFVNSRIRQLIPICISTIFLFVFYFKFFK
ncbi:EpsG family protein [Bacteroides faecichinchillae]|uniref:EpsG family protein n=1 Tax=Bacteroides faecichinchillae TaxID=871325 RepID=A0A1M5BQY4_9BACE|nr:EpsG family protein [Bacteroides faecichinchillae]THG60783.1 EpsG family protein [Bacteroides faecichinchillae]SHF44816.1 EpsG family protein [Bacteroides faecichinchillae]